MLMQGHGWHAGLRPIMSAHVPGTRLCDWQKGHATTLVPGGTPKWRRHWKQAILPGAGAADDAGRALGGATGLELTVGNAEWPPTAVTVAIGG